MAHPDPTAANITILVAHGSRNPRTAAQHVALCNAVSTATGDAAVLPAFLEISEPSIGEAIDEAIEQAGGQASGQAATRITVIPLFIHVGNHIERDITAIVDEARTRHPDVEVILTEHIGAAPGFVELIADQMRPAG